MFSRCCPKCRRILHGVLVAACVCGAPVHPPTPPAASPSPTRVAAQPPPDMPHGQEGHFPTTYRTAPTVAVSSASVTVGSAGRTVVWRLSS